MVLLSFNQDLHGIRLIFLNMNQRIFTFGFPTTMMIGIAISIEIDGHSF